MNPGRINWKYVVFFLALSTQTHTHARTHARARACTHTHVHCNSMITYFSFFIIKYGRTCKCDVIHCLHMSYSAKIDISALAHHSPLRGVHYSKLCRYKVDGGKWI